MHSITIKTFLAALLTVGLCVPMSIRAQESLDITVPRWKLLSQAAGFVIGQEKALEMIASKYPDLAKDGREAAMAFNLSALGEGAKGLNAELMSELGPKWTEVHEKLTAQLTEFTAKQNPTRQEASAFVEEVQRRAKGQMPEHVRTALLAANPRFKKNPASELTEGWKLTFRTKDHAKAKGADCSISVPASWNKREGNRPNIIQVFRSDAGKGSAGCALMVQTLPFPEGYKPTQQELRDFFKPDEMKDMIGEGSTFVSAEEIVLEGAPAGILVSDTVKQRLDIKVETRMTQFITIHKNSMIFIQCDVSRLPDDSETLNQLQKRYLPVFKAIANTLVLHDRYQ